MEAAFRLQDARIAIVGLGLMGGSLALALRGKCAGLYGIDADPAALGLAREQNVVDRAGHDPAEVLPRADLVVLATPVPGILEWLHRLPSLLQGPIIVLDLGSTKEAILQAMAALPGPFDPVGGHPICGKETLGLEHAEAGLFRNAPFVITPLARTTSRARQAVEQVVLAIGARAIEMDAGSHDRALGVTSHLPFLLSSALCLSTPQEFAPLAGTGFRSTGRLAGTPGHMMMGILQTNRENLLAAVRAFRGSLSELEAALEAEEYPRLESLLQRSRAAYQSLSTHH